MLYRSLSTARYEMLTALLRARAGVLACVVLLALSAMPAAAQTWAAVSNPNQFYAGVALLLTDGTVMVYDVGANQGGTGVWFRLTPDSKGNYADGTWSTPAVMPYAPLDFASAVLPDGKLIVEGGEYDADVLDDTNLGALFDPLANTWTSVQPPTGWAKIGDAPSAVLADGTFILGNYDTNQDVLLDEGTLTWATTGGGELNNEEGWELLPGGDVMTVGIYPVGIQNVTSPAVRYNPSTQTWTTDSTSPSSSLIFLCPGGEEIGPAVLRPDGTVFAVGGAGNTAVYSPTTSSWTTGPSAAYGWGAPDAPATLLPDGNVLFAVSPLNGSSDLCEDTGTLFYEFNGSQLVSDPVPASAANDYSSNESMLLLPNGQVLFTDRSTNISVFTPAGTYQSSWRPTITSSPSTVAPGSTDLTLQGEQLNGLSQGSMFGDDEQMATNFPLVRITNDATGDVAYCRTHDFSTMGVATGPGTVVSTEFDVPATAEVGASTLEVVANGIPSAPVAVNVLGTASVTLSPTSLTLTSRSGSSPQGTIQVTNDGPGSVTFASVWVEDQDGDFSDTTNCTGTLGQGGSCSVTVTFSPGIYCISGGDHGTLYISDDATTGGGLQTAGLQGNTQLCSQSPVRSGGARPTPSPRRR